MSQYQRIPWHFPDMHHRAASRPIRRQRSQIRRTARSIEDMGRIMQKMGKVTLRASVNFRQFVEAYEQESK